MEKFYAVLVGMGVGALIGGATLFLYLIIPPLWHFVLWINGFIWGIFGVHDKSTLKHIVIAFTFISPMLKHALNGLREG